MLNFLTFNYPNLSMNIILKDSYRVPRPFSREVTSADGFLEGNN